MPGWLTEDAILALIAQIGGILIAIVGSLGLLLVALVNRTRQHARAARVQVENSHATNMREEGDDRHSELMAAVNHIEGIQRGMQRDIGRLADADLSTARTVTGLTERVDQHILWSQTQANKISALEKTIPKNELPKETQ